MLKTRGREENLFWLWKGIGKASCSLQGLKPEQFIIKDSFNPAAHLSKNPGNINYLKQTPDLL